MDYTHSLIWLAAWPAVIYVSYRFVRLNVEEIARREREERR
jgi:hypothetical protein